MPELPGGGLQVAQHELAGIANALHQPGFSAIQFEVSHQLIDRAIS